MTSKSTSNPAAVIERLVFNNRIAVVLLTLLVSLFLLSQAVQVRPVTSFEKMIPVKHPYIEQML